MTFDDAVALTAVMVVAATPLAGTVVAAQAVAAPAAALHIAKAAGHKQTKDPAEECLCIAVDLAHHQKEFADSYTAIILVLYLGGAAGATLEA